MFFIIVLIVLFLAPLVLSLVFFVRFLITKKSAGCAIAGLVYVVFVVLIVGLIYFASTHISDHALIRLFEQRTDLTFPASGDITQRYRSSIGVLEGYYGMTLKMDSVDFMHILYEVRARYDAFTGEFEGIISPTTITYNSFHIPTQRSVYYAVYREWRGRRRFSLHFVNDKRTVYVFIQN